MTTPSTLSKMAGNLTGGYSIWVSFFYQISRSKLTLVKQDTFRAHGPGQHSSSKPHSRDGTKYVDELSTGWTSLSEFNLTQHLLFMKFHRSVHTQTHSSQRPSRPCLYSPIHLMPIMMTQRDKNYLLSTWPSDDIQKTLL